MNNLRFATVLTLEDIVSSSPDLQEFISALGLEPRQTAQQEEQPMTPS